MQRVAGFQFSDQFIVENLSLPVLGRTVTAQVPPGLPEHPLIDHDEHPDMPHMASCLRVSAGISSSPSSASPCVPGIGLEARIYRPEG